MIVKNIYWVFDKALSDKQCNEILDLLKQNESKFATIGGVPEDTAKEKLSLKELKTVKKFRNSNVVWRDDPWLYKYIHPFIYEANKNAEWNYQWDWSEMCQLTKYSKGQYYHWHQDAFREPYKENASSSSYIGKTRKLSSVVVLNNATEYKGGRLQFATQNNFNKPKIIESEYMLNKGSLIVFPSFIWHRVTPVTKGTRFSLTNWHLGNPYV